MTAVDIVPGKLVFVRTDDGDALAVVVALDWLLPRIVVRVWDGAAFGGMVYGDVADVLRLAPDDETTAAARAALAGAP